MIAAAAKRAFLAYHHRTSRVPQGLRVVSSIARQLGAVDSLLDVGCGDGVNTKRIGDMVGATQITGVDVHVRHAAVIPVKCYDGLRIDEPDASFDGVVLVDVLHHCTEPLTVLTEALRVCKRVLVIKDHFAFGAISKLLLYWMDMVGNAKDSIPSPGAYATPQEWVSLIARSGGRMMSLDWPLKTHDLPWRLVGWPELQFTARVIPVR
jgi:SAM-dependent methyltransferase